MANSYTFSAAQRVTIGNATKKTDIDLIAANTDYLKEALDTIMSSSAADGALTPTGFSLSKAAGELADFRASSGSVNSYIAVNTRDAGNDVDAALNLFTKSGGVNSSAQFRYYAATQRLAVDVDGSEAVSIDLSQNVSIGTSSIGASAAGVLAIANGTQGGALANAIQIVSEDLSAGNTIPSIRTEGSGIYSAGTPAAATGSIAIKVNGTVYYLTASTTAAS